MNNKIQTDHLPLKQNTLTNCYEALTQRVFVSTDVTTHLEVELHLTTLISVHM